MKKIFSILLWVMLLSSYQLRTILTSDNNLSLDDFEMLDCCNNFTSVKMSDELDLYNNLNNAFLTNKGK